MFVLLAASVLASGCSPSLLELRHDGVYQLRVDYRIRSDNPAGYGFVSPEWRIDNFAMASRPPRPKNGSDYMSIVSFDHQDDGRVDARERVLRYDLKLVHRRRNAELFVRSVPLGQGRRESELRVLARDYVESVAGAGYVNVQLGAIAVGIERRYATRVIEEHPFVVSGFAAWAVTFDVANVDQLQMSDDASFERVRVVLVRTNLGWRSGDHMYPVLLIVGYASHPDDFAQDLDGLDTLLNLIEFRRPGTIAGPPGPVTTGPPPNATPPAPAPTPPPTPAPPPPTVPPPNAPSIEGDTDTGDDATPWEG
jgi:hypothetical protein